MSNTVLIIIALLIASTCGHGVNPDLSGIVVGWFYFGLAVAMFWDVKQLRAKFKK